jgi:hypothetical protein
MGIINSLLGGGGGTRAAGTSTRGGWQRAWAKAPGVAARRSSTLRPAAAAHAVALRSWPLVALGAGGDRTESAPQMEEIRNWYDTWDPPAQSNIESSILKSLLDLITFLLASDF